MPTTTTSFIQMNMTSEGRSTTLFDLCTFVTLTHCEGYSPVLWHSCAAHIILQDQWIVDLGLSVYCVYPILPLSVSLSHCWSQQYFITCQSCADSATIHSAVTGAGLIHYFIKGQVLRVICQEKTDTHIVTPVLLLGAVSTRQNIQNNALSQVVFGAGGFLVAQLVRICLPPNH